MRNIALGLFVWMGMIIAMPVYGEKDTVNLETVALTLGMAGGTAVERLSSSYDVRKIFKKEGDLDNFDALIFRRGGKPWETAGSIEVRNGKLAYVEAARGTFFEPDTVLFCKKLFSLLSSVNEGGKMIGFVSTSTHSAVDLGLVGSRNINIQIGNKSLFLQIMEFEKGTSIYVREFLGESTPPKPEK
ncbi:MAG: hypothetical protein LAO31_02280 [Acidobacteriia bacterium]|nr:hypothetical protein [Terriglobia bacterium]